jgi:hypothetical protein
MENKQDLKLVKFLNDKKVLSFYWTNDIVPYKIGDTITLTVIDPSKPDLNERMSLPYKVTNIQYEPCIKELKDINILDHLEIDYFVEEYFQ